MEHFSTVLAKAIKNDVANKIKQTNGLCSVFLPFGTNLKLNRIPGQSHGVDPANGRYG